MLSPLAFRRLCDLYIGKKHKQINTESLSQIEKCSQQIKKN